VNTKTQTIIQKLLHQADYYDLLGETYDGQLMREAAAALVESRHDLVRQNLIQEILQGGK
jgi:uncharacterized membrane protein YgaE (UPF0421/DUF939 family)